jgi:single-strand selective monofunctional uracil DNA glycosylase
VPANALVAVSRRLARAVDRLSFAAPVAYVYDPLIYARAPHEAYLERWGAGPRETLLLGMNPGPFGMAQTGVPFGDVAMVRDFLGITGLVKQPMRVHPKRPIEGFACRRAEVSGTRLWGWARDRFGTADRFFARFFVANYCPLVFVEPSGRNFTPDKLPSAEQAPLFAACDEALRAIVAHLRPRLVIGVGAFAAARAEGALVGQSLRVGTILHPSPANPQANRDWGGTADRQLAALGVTVP